MLTSTRPKIRPAPIVPMPAIKNGIDTCSVVFHHSSCLIGGCTIFDGFRSKPPFSSKLPLSWPFGSSDDTMDVVVIELNEPSDEACLENFSFSLSVRRNTGKSLVVLPKATQINLRNTICPNYTRNTLPKKRNLKYIQAIEANQTQNCGGRRKRHASRKKNC